MNLSAVNSSVVPSSLIREYLVEVKGKNTSLSSAVIELDNLLLAIFTLNVFLTVRIASVRFTPILSNASANAPASKPSKVLTKTEAFCNTDG